MSLSGSLSEFTVSEILQFIQLGRRTGTLKLEQGERRAVIGFHQGRLISAKAPGLPRLGELLVQAGLTDPITVRNAARLQAEDLERRSLGQILVSTGALDEANLREVVGRQIQHTLTSLLGWSDGSFDFVVGDLRPSDDIAFYLGDILPDLDIQPHMVLMAARSGLDEAIPAATGVEGSPGGATSPHDESHPTLNFLLFDEGTTLGGGMNLTRVTSSDQALLEIQAPGPGARPLHLVMDDESLAQRLADAAPNALAQPALAHLAQAGFAPPGTLAPMIVVDLRQSQVGLVELSDLRRRRPESPVIALVEPGVALAEAYGAGALAVVPDDPRALASCLSSCLEALATAGSSVQPKQAEGLEINPLFAFLESLQEVAERGVLFCPAGDRLQAMGAFGEGSAGRSLAELVRGIGFEPSNGGLLGRSAGERLLRSVPYRERDLPPTFAARVGAPRSLQAVLLPVPETAGRSSLIYLDNGSREEAIQDLGTLAVAAGQVSSALHRTFGS